MLYFIRWKQMKIINQKKGISLIEALLAIAIIVIASTGILQFYIANFSLYNTNKERGMSLAHLANIMEKIKCTPFNDLTVDFPNAVADGPQNSYSAIVGGYTLNNEHITVSYIDPADDPLEINITLDWQDARGVNRTEGISTKRTR